MFSLIIPVYNNAESLNELLLKCGKLHAELGGALEVLFVIDGSPDDSEMVLRRAAPKAEFPIKVVSHSRNFGSFAAIRTGLSVAGGTRFGVMAADLQEPPEWIVGAAKLLEDDGCDLVVGVRENRSDPVLSKFFASLFWFVMRKAVLPELPRGGVDLFACNALVRDALLTMHESNSSLIGQLFWVGFRRKELAYSRNPRKHGRSAWTFRKKWKYMADSIFSFSDLPVRVLVRLGTVGLLTSIGVGVVAIAGKILGLYEVPGYATTVVTLTFFAGLNSLGLGIIGIYVWRTYENTKRRPQSLIQRIWSPTP